MVCDAVAEAHPAFARDDERLFRIARLVISAIVAKIHTVDWTVELLKTETLRLAMFVPFFFLSLVFLAFRFLLLPTGMPRHGYCTNLLLHIHALLFSVIKSIAQEW